MQPEPTCCDPDGGYGVVSALAWALVINRSKPDLGLQGRTDTLNLAMS